MDLKKGNGISMLTAYDSMTASIIDEAGIDIILVGDSLGNVFQGKDSTKFVSMEDMIYHTRSVKNGVSNAHILVDLPYQSYENKSQALFNSKMLVENGADSVKLEGYQKGLIRYLVDNDISVCGHVGLLPQTAIEFKVQGKDLETRSTILEQAKLIEEEGASMIVVECVPASLGKEITENLSIPVIGIGAGSNCDGQVLVINDMLGINTKCAKFVRQYADLNKIIKEATKNYIEDVKSGKFPNINESYK